MNSILLSTQECGSQELLQLTEMLCREQDFQIIVSRAFPFMEKERKTKTVENRAGDLLTKLGFKANLKGVVYLKAAARIGLEDREELEGITKRLYPAIAKECRTCAGRVEHAIRHAIHTSWEKGDVRQQRMVFGYDRESGNRPTNAEFIARMIDCLERQIISYIPDSFIRKISSNLIKTFKGEQRLAQVAPETDCSPFIVDRYPEASGYAARSGRYVGNHLQPGGSLCFLTRSDLPAACRSGSVRQHREDGLDPARDRCSGSEFPL